MLMIFKPAARYPADPRAVFILVVSVFTGLTALAIEAAPESLTTQIPQWAALTWTIILISGSITTLIGMAFQSINGIVLEQVGSVAVGVSAIFYSCIAFAFAGLDSLQSIGIIFAWGVACLLRWLQLQILIRSALKRQQNIQRTEALYANLQARAAREQEELRRRRKWGTD